MESDRDRHIRARAYELWEAGGRQHGHAEAHWHQARGEVGAVATAAKAGKPAKAAAAKPASRSPTSAKKAGAADAAPAGEPGPKKAKATPGARAKA